MTLIKLKQTDWKRVIWIGILFILWFTLLFMNRNLVFFLSDEGDNFLGGKMVANGLDIYKEFTSQHMPVLYYICAVFYLIGARTVIEFRLLFYLFLCFIWMGMYIRYSRFFGKITMMLYPMLYIFTMRFMQYGHCVLSEQMWAQGIVILFLEYLIYTRYQEITLISSCWISFSIFISFGTSFMAAASIGVICLAVLVKEIEVQRKKGSDIKNGSINLWKRMWKLFAIVIFPFAILLFWYAISGNLYNAYYGSFVVNRKYYPKYMTSLESTWNVLIDPLKQFKMWLWQMDQTIVYLQIIFFGFFMLFLLLKKRYFDSIVIFFFTIFCGVRGIGMDQFHGIPIHAIFMMMGALLIEALLQNYIKPKLEKCKDKDRFIGCLYLLIVVVAIGFPLYRPYYEARDQLLISEGENTNVLDEGHKAVIKLTGKNEKIYGCTLDTWYYFMTDTLPATTSAVCPWIYEAYKDDILEDLESKKPRIVIYSEDFNVWGYRFGDFAPELCRYLRENYTELKGYADLYVRKDYYSEAKDILSN